MPRHTGQRAAGILSGEGYLPTITESLRVDVRLFSGDGYIPNIGQSTGVYYCIIPLIYLWYIYKNTMIHGDRYSLSRQVMNFNETLDK
jgi:hypothetical protein